VSQGAATLTPVFAALGDDTRWSILVRLAEAPASASALARELPITRQGIVKHLEVLRAAGLVETEQRGRELVFRALGGRLSDVARRLEEIGRSWEVRLAGIKELAEASEDGLSDEPASRPS
jgi:DNA-binding transcriptional ArsR family regulator